MDNDFPFSPVSFYLKYLVYKNIIDLFIYSNNYCVDEEIYNFINRLTEDDNGVINSDNF